MLRNVCMPAAHIFPSYISRAPGEPSALDKCEIMLYLIIYQRIEMMIVAGNFEREK